jgi:putative ABC transport system permease protein
MTAFLTRLLGRLPIGWLQLRHNRNRLIAALAGVTFANLLIYMQLGFLGGLLNGISLPYASFDADILIQASDANTLQDGSPLPRNRMLEALAIPGVAEATPLYIFKMDWKQPDGTIRTLDVMGVDPRMANFRVAEIEAARPLLALSNAALIDRGTRNVPPELFDEIDAGRPYRIETANRSVNILGSFRIGGGFGADGVMVVSDQTFLKLFRNRTAGAPNIILVRAAPGQAIEPLIARLRAALPAADTAVRSIDEAIRRDQNFQTTQRPVGIVFGFGVVIGALVGIIIVYQVLASDVADHMREYATFKAIGYRQSFFLGVIFEEAVILALFGFLPGTALAIGLYAAVKSLAGLPLEMTGNRMLFMLLGTIIMCTLSGAIATRRLAKADPAALF